ncbi:hypothetical protein [Brachyspira alvinipulli]|uniref:hypothetical protein n=1 Tax=Brachyspira alvinipulli TaxID=84379 RepID=UPI00048896A0|nr:hypothetical protein [Brachyspira alvinipulli]
MSIFDIIVDAVDGFDEKFEDTLQFLNEKIEKPENKRNNKVNRVSDRVYRRKRTSSKNINNAPEKINKNNVLKEKDKKEEKEIKQNKEIKTDISIDIINKCKNKIKEIRELIENFDYTSRKSYEYSCTDLEKSLEYVKNADELNKIIEYVNNLYKSAYYKKHNKSSLSFIMDDDENLDYIKLGGINE